MEHRLFGPCKCGAVSKRSAIDLTTAFTYGAGEVWKHGHVARLDDETSWVSSMAIHTTDCSASFKKADPATDFLCCILHARP